MLTTLQTDILNFSNILQIGDLHVRLTKRHQEFIDIFDKLYTEIDKTPKETAICVLGDTFHQKSDLSAESVEVVSNLFRNLANRRPTIIIAGNHDSVLSNRNRLDSITPLINALNHPNLHYSKESGLYLLGDILFNNWSIFDEPEKYIKFDGIPKKYLNNSNHIIALYHGIIDNAFLNLDLRISNKAIPPEIFDGHHLVLAGDLHMAQTIQEYNYDLNKPAIRYSGSLIMQNHGEDRHHGFSLWCLKTKTYEYIEIPNDYGYFTIEVNNGKIITDLKDVPKKARLRMRLFECGITETKKALAQVRSVSDVNEVVYERVASPHDKLKVSVSGDANISLLDLRKSEYQKILMLDYIKNKFPNLKQEIIDVILKINEECNTAIEKDDVARNVRWRPKRFEWSNLFSYGPDNVIDFTKTKGVVGLFAKNCSGKSNMLSALSFCIFDKADRTSLAGLALNFEKDSFKCKFNFDIDGIDYFIEKVGTADKERNVRVDIKFYKIENGQTINLQGKERRDTSNIIRKYLGSYDDFILTAMSIQSGKNVSNFIDLGNLDRKELLAQFTGLNIFDKLHECASEKSKVVSSLINQYKQDDFTLLLVNTSNNLNISSSLYNDENRIMSSWIEKRNSLNQRILEESMKIIKIDDNIPYDIDTLLSNKQQYEVKIKEEISAVNQLKIDVENKKREIDEIDIKIKEQETLNILGNYKKYQEIKSSLNALENEMGVKKAIEKTKIDKLIKLKEHKYDKNCIFCMNNIFVKDAIRTQSELAEDKIIYDKLLVRQSSIKSELEKLQWVVSANETYTGNLNNKNKLGFFFNSINDSLIEREKLIEHLNSKLEKTNNYIELYRKNQNSIEVNNKINVVITELKQNLKNIEFEIDKKNKKLMEINGGILILNTKIDEIKEKIRRAREMEIENEAYLRYLDITGRNGIQFNIIKNTVPKIEDETNNLLAQITDFRIEFDADEKNINPYICRENKKRYPIELSCGFERFAANLSIRIALIKTSNLSSPNFIAVDEGFGVLDSENMVNIQSLLYLLKSEFDFVIIISHISDLKGMVDEQIEMVNDNGFSKINFV